MSLITFVETALQETRQRTLELTKDISLEELCWCPSQECNPVGFLLWHLARIEDIMLNRLLQRKPEIWESQNWYQKMNKPLRDSGFGYTAEQVRCFAVPTLADLQAYLAAVREEFLAYLRRLTPEKFDELARPDRPEWTVGRIFYQSIMHENQHLGTIEYLRGLYKAQPSQP